MTGKAPSRRVVLKLGLAGSAVLALGGVGLLLRRGKVEPAPARPLLVLEPHEYAVLCALGRRFVPASKGEPSADELQVGLECDHILSMVDPTARTEMRQLLNLFENALPNLLFGGRVTPFTLLSPEEQDLVLHEWLVSRLAVRRTGVMALRSLVLAAYYGNPQSWVTTGYPGPPAGFHQPDAPVWVGGGQPRPISNGTWLEPQPPSDGATP